MLSKAVHLSSGFSFTAAHYAWATQYMEMDHLTILQMFSFASSDFVLVKLLRLIMNAAWCLLLRSFEFVCFLKANRGRRLWLERIQIEEKCLEKRRRLCGVWSLSCLKSHWIQHDGRSYKLWCQKWMIQQGLLMGGATIWMLLPCDELAASLRFSVRSASRRHVKFQNICETVTLRANRWCHGGCIHVLYTAFV